MHVKSLTVRNFRNYRESRLVLDPVRNVLIGENAQGKTNLLEAIELVSSGRSNRASSDRELILRGAEQALVEVSYLSQGLEETVTLILTQGQRLSRKIKVNGATQSRKEMGGSISRLTAVSFNSHDLNLLRGGPKYRRDWLDGLVTKLRPSFISHIVKYEKVVSQRNRLLKQFFERGRLTVSDMDELAVWDVQIARYGALIVKARVEALRRLLPLAEANQSNISKRKEVLSASYEFKQADDDDDRFNIEENRTVANIMGIEELNQTELPALEGIIARSLKVRRGEEIARKQTLTGPHRDDISFDLNDFSAVTFASQGQQRSLVLALKLAELKIVEDVLEEPPLLLLDDVLAELDLGRQGMLMQLVNDRMQTLITTTHLDGFRSEWLEGALVTKVESGSLVYNG